MGGKPNHIAVTMGGNKLYAARKRISAREKYNTMFDRVNELIKLQTGLNIPIITLYALTSKVRESEDFSAIMDSLEEFFERLTDNAHVFKHKIKVSVLGKWYDLPGRVVQPIKKIVDETREYDSFFLNICVNYDGKEEIVDACKMIGRKIKAGRLDPELIDRETIKDGMYSSYFLPPDILIKTGPDKKLNGFLMWDTTQSHIFFSGRPWPEFGKKELVKAIREWSSTKSST